ncbi:MAG TPA: fibronectin type III domain-containing protein [Steroidobacteraceae bacterium]|nr:fibronectin type III domain-containing protein [Steroidobacteraceae bacterium]
MRIASSALMGLLAVGARTQAADNARVFAAQTPGGAVRVLVVVADGRWPAGGMRILDGAGNVLVPHAEPDRDAINSLDGASQAALGALRAEAKRSDASMKAAASVLALRILSDWRFAQALGAAVELPSALHPRGIRVVLLNADGSEETTLPTVNVPQDLGPGAPSDLRALAAANGVTLQWQSVGGGAVPAYAYEVSRTSGATHDRLTPHPQLLTRLKSGLLAPFIDRTPPVDTTLTYSVSLVDVLGVAGAGTSMQVASPDFEASAPPAGQLAKSDPGFVIVTWTASSNPRTGGFVVERSQLAAGPYEVLTPQGLAANVGRFEDRHTVAGAHYYYRIRAMTGSGALGAATDPVQTVALGAATLPAPQRLKAESGATQVTLTWTAVPGTSVAGYLIERRATATARWGRLNVRLWPETHFVDALGPSAGGGFDYRITAVSGDESAGAPSDVVHVTLIDTSAPPAPRVISALGAEGRVQLHFAAAEPAAKTDKVALVRSESPAEEGLVIGAPVDVASGVLEDDWVQAGQRYWYRLVAFDKAGNRSAETEAYEVRVAAPTLPAPKAPRLSLASSPAPAVELSFDPPPANVLVLIEVQREDGRWRRVLGPMAGNKAVDSAPPNAHASYRLVYVGKDGAAGPPSPSASAP